MSTPISVSNFNFNPNDIRFMLFVKLKYFCSVKLINKPDSKLLVLSYCHYHWHFSIND